MHLQIIALAILLFATLNIISAKDEDEEGYDSEFPCKLFAQTCLDLCLENDAEITNFSASCDAETSLCKCNDDELTLSVFKKSKDLYDDSMELQVEEQNGNVAAVKMFNLVLEQDVEYDELGQGDESQVDQPENNNKENDILEEIKNKELGGEDDGANGYINNQEEQEEIVDESELALLEESRIFCPSFIKRCMDDCPTASSRPSCGLDIETTGYLLVCECNGIDISNSVRSQVMAEVFYSTV